MRRRTLATALVFSLFAIPAAAAITGSVMNTDGAPIAGARVSIYAPELPEARRVRLLSQSPMRVPAETAQTDAKGAFSLPSPKEATVELRIDAAGYEPHARRIERDEDAGAIALTKRETRKGAITAAGKPVPNATVLISYNGTDFIARTDEQGRYDAPDVKRARSITVLHPDYAIDEESTAMNPGLPSSDMNRTLTAGTKITGRVVAADGTTPVAGATILVDQWPLGTSGEDGTFTIAHAPKKYTTLTARKDSLLAQRTSDAVKGSTTLKLEKAAVVSGRIIDSKTKLPVAAASVSLNPQRRFFFLESSTLAVFTDAKGAYSIAAPAGTYNINAMHPAFESGSAEVTVTAGQQVAKEVAMTQLARVSGVVVDEMQKPVVAATVTSEQASEGNAMRMMPMRMVRQPARVVSGPDGRFSLRMMADQDLRLTATKKGMPPAKGETLRLGPAERKTGVVLLVPTGIAVSGVVKDANGDPLSGVSVVATETPMGRGGMMFRQVVMAGAGGEEEDVVLTASDGTFTLRVKEGTYDFSFRREGYAPKAVRAQSVTLQGAPPIETTMEPAVEISGRVTRAGVGIPDVTVHILGPSDSNSAVTGPDGSFTLGGLSPGSTRLMLRKDTEFIQEQRSATAPARDVVFDLPAGGRVTGRVVEKGSRKPITTFQAGITTSRGGGGFVMMGPPQLKSFTSDDGSFTLENVPAGSMNVIAQAPGYANGRASVDVEEGKTASDITIELDTGVRLVGKVTGPNGAGLSDATVEMRPSPTGQFSRGSMRRAVTDANGEYTLESLDPGDETFEISHPKYLATTKDISLKGREMRMDVQLSGGQRVTGIVVTDSGMPVAEAEVDAFTASGMGNERTRTNASGQFEFTSLSASRYRFTANKPGHLEGVVEDVDVSSGGNVRIQMRTGGTIYGRISGLTEQELSGATVTARAGRTSTAAAVDPQGNFRIEGTPVGTVQVSASSSSRGFTERRSSGTQTVEVSAGSAVQVNLEFRADTVVRGRITRNGAPLGGATVMFSPRGGSRASASTSADEAGNYSVAGLEEGEYSVMVADINRFNPYQTTYQVRAGASTFDIDYRVGSVRGRVIDASTNEPLADATVSFRPAGTGEMRFVRSAVTDPSGNFTMESVSPGSYTLTASREGYGADVKDEVFGDSGRDGLEFRIGRADGITLKIVDGRDGRAITAFVTAWDPAGRVVHDPTSGMLIGAGGARDQQIPLPPGSYTVSVSMTGYATQTLQVTAPSVRTVALTPGGTILVQSKHSTTRRMRLLDASGMAYPRLGSRPTVRDLLPGTVPFEHVAPGSYTLQLLNDNETVADTVSVVVREGETARVSI